MPADPTPDKKPAPAATATPTVNPLHVSRLKVAAANLLQDTLPKARNLLAYAEAAEAGGYADRVPNLTEAKALAKRIVG